MGRSLSGTIGESFAFTFSRFGGLFVVSFLPFAVMTALTVFYFIVLADRFAEVGSDPEALAAAGNSWQDLVFMLATLPISSWFMAKVWRYYLADEPASLIGSGGTFRCGLMLLLYMIGLVLLCYIPMIILIVVASLVLLQVETVAIIVIIAIFLVGIWVLLRLFVGLPPLSLGENVGFFSGWTISQGAHISLFLRYIALTVLMIVLMTVVMGVVGYIAYLVLGDLMNTNLTLVAAIGAVLYMVVIMFMYWPFMVFLAEAYVRLSGRSRPLPIS